MLSRVNPLLLLEKPLSPTQLQGQKPVQGQQLAQGQQPIEQGAEVRLSLTPALPKTAIPAATPKAGELLGEWQEYMQLMVKPKRYEHVLRVAALARDIARVGGLDAERAYAAGILHDIARDLPDSELLRLAPPETEIDRLHPLALHGRAARTLLERWGYTDQEVLEAVEDHTTGPRSSSGIAACVYVADVSEPGRGVNADIRELAHHDLQAALAQAIGSKVRYLQGRGITVHPRTLEAYKALQARGALPQDAHILPLSVPQESL